MALIFPLLVIYGYILSLQSLYKLVEVVDYTLCSFVPAQLGGKTMFNMSLKSN